MKTSIFELIRQAELLNNESILYFLNHIEGNIGVSQILVLNQLREKGPLMQTELAKKLGYTPGGMTSIANKLIKEGYAEREYDAADRRIVRLAITSKGYEIFIQAQEIGQAMRRDLYSILTDEEIQQMARIQRKLIEHIVKD
ncbi:DNA-binding MarR family transcriptional regulator [Sporosarcina luteola]|nr:DNA-binding MarR family transcriptional regulator [Sporosarcina luteola]